MSEVNVFVRLRPIFYNEKEKPENACIRTSSNTSLEMINLRNTKETLKFEFEQVFNEDSSQEEVFGTVAQPILSRFTDDLQNVSIFAYGPTGSGKTYTILGNDESPGFIPRCVRHLFVRIRQTVASRPVNSSISMSYLEVYQEKVFDLLAGSRKLETICQDARGCISVKGLTESVISTFSEFEQLFVPASRHRRVAETKVNERSSRSHTLLIIKLITVEREKPYRKRTAKLSIIDLAGSEDNRLTGNEGVRLKESSAINSSLHVLGKVVSALVQKQSRIPYRDSKLTRLLQDSLGGSAHTCMVVNVSPEMSSIFDTHRALTFAVSSKSVINRPFTRESIAAPPSSPIEVRRGLTYHENGLPRPIFSPAIRCEAKKRSLKLERFDDSGDLVSSSKRQSQGDRSQSRDIEAQKQFINAIRNSTKFFKMLQDQPRSESQSSSLAAEPSAEEDSLTTGNCASAEEDYLTTGSEMNSSRLFTIKQKKEKYVLVTLGSKN